MAEKVFSNAFEYKVIYVFEIKDQLHAGLLKIGDATIHTETPIDQLTPNCRELNQAALARIKSYTNTAGLTPKLLWAEVAVRTERTKDGTALKAFRDHQVHAVLKNSKIKPKELGGSKEWFEVDLATAKNAIEAVKHGYANLSNTGEIVNAPIIFRPEQVACIDKVTKHFKKADRFLINAKMRYGKTFVSLEIIKQCKFKKTIIMTHRPVVDAGWYEDFTKIFNGTDYIYGSKGSGYTVKELLKMGKPFIYFASVQDLRGSSAVGGKFDKNNAVFNTQWDCVVVDEAHEGTTTMLGEDTVKAVFKEGSGTKLLALSGTPFNILDNYDEDSIYTWDYIMEQECKSEWDSLHFGDSNPYDELPEMKIYTYSLGDILHNANYIAFEDKAFNFKEFFRTFTGDFKEDCADMPAGSKIGDFVHEADVWSFLNLMTKESDESYYPFSNEEYRSLFKHTLWMVPGVKEAKALKKLMLKHPVFGSGQFNIVNVAGNGDEEEASEEALSKVRKAIKSAGDDYTITLSCGKLTTGVTVKEWTAVFMLAGSYSTSAANYLQTIFRVQSPCNQNGKIKENAYVFDFAPDRTLKMVASAVSVSHKVGKTKDGDGKVLGKFLNYCPVIGISGSEMQAYSATKLLQQLKKAYAEKVVRNGFDDSTLYNDELFKLDAVDIKKFDELKGIIGQTKANQKSNDITVNDQGLTKEEYEELEKAKKKKKKDLTPEEKARLEELNKLRKLRNDAISILRGISIRMPLLIYGADIPYDEEITLDRFVDLVDDTSWAEFMPNGVDKEKFREFQKYYDEEVFIAAGRRIRNIAREADTLDPTERVIKIASLFSYFKNPDKETVLTPWRVVNMHMSDTLGGWDFWDEKHENVLDTPRFVDQGDVTAKTFRKPDANILEINSKTGLYPLYVTYSCYRTKLDAIKDRELSIEEKQALWDQTVKANVYIICKTPMAKTITKRTLLGYRGGKMNAHAFDDLVNTLQNKPDLFQKKVLRGNFWGKDIKKMQWNAILGNPPYQQTISNADNASLSKQVFPAFIQQSIELNAEYVSLITPSRWFTADAQDKSFIKLREYVLDKPHFEAIYHYADNKDVFSGVEIAGGVNYFLYHNSFEGNVDFFECTKDHKECANRPLFEDGLDIILSMNSFVNVLNKVRNSEGFVSMMEITQGRNAFGITGKASELVKITEEKPFNDSYEVRCAHEEIRYTKKSNISKNIDIADKWKVFTSKGNGGAGILNSEKAVAIIGKAYIGAPKSICTDSLIPIGCFETEAEAKNLQKYMSTKFFRFMIGILKVSQNIYQNVYRFAPKLDFTNDSDIRWTTEISNIDQQLYEKYGLSEAEKNMIETMIKPME